MTNEEIEKEIKDKVIDYFKSNHSDEFGYVTEKVDKINNLKENDSWIAFNFLHVLIRKALFPKLSKESQEFLIKNEVYIPE